MSILMQALRKKWLITALLFLSLLFSIPLKAIQTLSEQGEISVLTCSPGEDLYSVFGHSAIWVYDPENEIDRVYNYGTFEFSPDFYLKFIKGQLNYYLSVSDYDDFEWEYYIEGRAIYRQFLNLSGSQKQLLFEMLETNYFPENRFYLYDFFYDNCSSRIRDIINVGLNGNVNYTGGYAEAQRSFRDLIKPYLVQKPWADFGIDLGLGLPADKIAQPHDYMFLPFELMKHFGAAQIQNDEMQTPLIGYFDVLLYPEPLSSGIIIFSPVNFFWTLFIIVLLLTLYQLKKEKVIFWPDRILFGITGFLGLFICFLWFGTDHNATIHNFNLLWAWPFHVILAFLPKHMYGNKFIEKYLFIYIIALAIMLAGWSLIPQKLNVALVPVILLLALRSVFISRKLQGMISKNPD